MRRYFLTIKVMNKFLPVSFSLLLILSNWNILPVDAGRSRPSCNSALKSFRSSLPDVRSFQFNSLGQRGQPAGRTKSLDITFNSDVAISREKQLSIAAQIIKNCSQVGSVSFSVYRTDGGNLYGIINGQVIVFPCQENELQPTRWGENRCL